jgi:hypothetical protein
MRDNSNNSGSGGAGQIKPVDWTRTENQLSSHESFAPEHIVARGDVGVSAAPLPTMRLAVPPPWTHRDGLPCVQRVPRGNQPDPYDTNDKRVAKALCAGCPVKQACLDEAMELEEGLGPRSRYLVRGGLTPKGRARQALSNSPK